MRIPPPPANAAKFKAIRSAAIGLLLAAGFLCRANDLETMGVSLLRAGSPGLTGGGVTVAQAEAEETQGGSDWEVNPGDPNQPISLFTWTSNNVSATNFPNSIGMGSGHAGNVGNFFYGGVAGVAPGVAHVDNDEANAFIQYIVSGGIPIPDAVVNQSFTFGVLPVVNTGSNTTQQEVDSAYDNYIATNGSIFCSSGPDGGQVCAPATSYNSIGVGAYGIGAQTCYGPTLDNGRSKPDIVAPGLETSFATPYVAGAAAVLIQAAALGDGGTNTTAAGDLRTVKALLLNGAVKPSTWSHTTNMPLDANYGAGVANLFYSHEQLAGGQEPFGVSQTLFAGGPHLPGPHSSNNPALLGWDFQTFSSGPINDVVNHYYFDNSANPAAELTLTATLVWNRAENQTNINNLALFLYNSANSNLTAASTSMVDNVQHIYVPSLPPGQYDLQVVKYGGLSEVSPSETYALAFQFFPVSPPRLGVELAGGSVVVSWPWSPTIFNLWQTTNLAGSVSWQPVATAGLISNTTVSVTINPGGTAGYYRLSR